MSSTTTAEGTRDGRVVEILVHFTAELLVLISLWFLTLEKEISCDIYYKMAACQRQGPTAVYHQGAILIHVQYIALSTLIYLFKLYIYVLNVLPQATFATQMCTCIQKKSLLEPALNFST